MCKMNGKMKYGFIFFLGAFFLRSTACAQTEGELRDSIPEVVVTGTGTQHLLRDVPVQTEVISGKMLRNYAGKSIQDLLAGLTSSFDFNEDDMGSQMQMNGLGNSYILILIDGKRIHGDVGGQNDLSLIDPQHIEKIEIVKGASSALYGSDAIAGVIHIITKKPDEGLLLENTTRAGSYGDIRQHDGIGLKFGKWSSYTNFQLQHSDGWQNTATEDPNQTEFLITDSRNKTVNRHTSWQIAERLSYAFNQRLEVYAQGSTHWKRIYRVSGKYPSCDVKTYDLEYHNASVNAGGKWQINPTDAVSWEVSWDKHAYFYNYTDTTLTDAYVNGTLDHYFPYFPGQKNLQSNQERSMVQMKGVFALPYENRLNAGFEWRYDWLHAPMRVVNGKAHDHTAALYLQDEFDLLRPLNITAGIRLNKNAAFGFRATPKISAMLSLGDFRLRATWSQGFKTPTPKELHYRYLREMSGVYLYLGNKKLRPQTSDYYAFNAEYRIHKFAVSVTGYYNHVDRMIALVTIPRSEAPGADIAQYDPVKVRQYKNLESAETYGADVHINYSMTNEITVGAGYSYLDTKAKTYDSAKELLQDVVIDGMAHHKANFFATWGHRFTPAYRLSLGIYGKMSTKRYYQINGNGKGYQIWKLSTAHELGKSKRVSYRLEAGIDNIFNYVDRTYHGLHVGTTTPGTTIFASFAVKFSQGKKLTNKYKFNLNQNYNEEN